MNLRFYVKREVGGEVRRGVAFIKEIVPRWAIAATARWAYNEPYVALPMRHEISGPAAEAIRESCGYRTAAPASDAGASHRVAYGWRLAGRWNSLSVRHTGAAEPLRADSHEAFIAEHYWGYCRQRDGGTVEYQVVHPSWRIWPGIDPQVDCDAEALYGRVWADVLSAKPTSAFVADGSEIAVMRPLRICLSFASASNSSAICRPHLPRPVRARKSGSWQLKQSRRGIVRSTVPAFPSLSPAHNL